MHVSACSTSEMQQHLVSGLVDRDMLKATAKNVSLVAVQLFNQISFCCLLPDGSRGGATVQTQRKRTSPQPRHRRGGIQLNFSYSLFAWPIVETIEGRARLSGESAQLACSHRETLQNLA